MLIDFKLLINFSFITTLHEEFNKLCVNYSNYLSIEKQKNKQWKKNNYYTKNLVKFYSNATHCWNQTENSRKSDPSCNLYRTVVKECQSQIGKCYQFWWYQNNGTTANECLTSNECLMRTKKRHCKSIVRQRPHH